VRWGWLVLAVLAGACRETKSSPRGLRVPLPDGWVANAGAGGVLLVGPKGRGVLTLERRTATLPTVDALKAAVEAEGAVVVRASGAIEATTLRYTRPTAAGLLSVRTLENGVLLLCASTPSAGEEDLEAAETLCEGVRLEPVPR
jgi:hypothetical protein